MINTAPILVVEQPYDQALEWAMRQIDSQGLQAVVTFDLQVARLAHGDCSCPHHGTQACDCRLNVLLIYGLAPGPVSLVAHGYDGKTWFSLVDTPHQLADQNLERIIRRILAFSPL